MFLFRNKKAVYCCSSSHLRVADLQPFQLGVLHPHGVVRQNSAAEADGPEDEARKRRRKHPSYLLRPPSHKTVINDCNQQSSCKVQHHSYFVSSVLRNRLCTIFLSSAVGATFRSEAVLSSTRRDLFSEKHMRTCTHSQRCCG